MRRLVNLLRQTCTRRRLFLEGIDEQHLKAFKVPDVSGDSGELLYQRAGRDRGILKNRIRLPVHQLRPQAEGCRVHGQYVEGRRDLIGPCFQFGRLGGVLLAGNFNAGVDFAERNGRKVEIGIGNSFDPRHHVPVRTWLAQLRNDVGIQQIYVKAQRQFDV